MTDKEFRHLSKADLIEIIYRMKKTEEELQSRLEATEAELNDRNVKLLNAGSIAEAAIGVNDVIGATQKAADDYLKQIHDMNENIETRCAVMLANTESECRKREQETDEKINRKWEDFQRKTQDYIETHAELKRLLRQ